MTLLPSARKLFGTRFCHTGFKLLTGFGPPIIKSAKPRARAFLISSVQLVGAASKMTAALWCNPGKGFRYGSNLGTTLGTEPTQTPCYTVIHHAGK
jgi:hypothetical protein